MSEQEARSAASGRWEFCGDGQPHERHEFIRGALRCGCPGSPSATSRLASGAEVPDVPVRPARSAATVCKCGHPKSEHDYFGCLYASCQGKCGPAATCEHKWTNGGMVTMPYTSYSPVSHNDDYHGERIYQIALCEKCAATTHKLVAER